MRIPIAARFLALASLLLSLPGNRVIRVFAQPNSAPTSSRISPQDSSPENQKTSTGSTTLYLPIVTNPAEDAWPMAGGNPERTSWTPTEVKGTLRPRWYKPIEPYISPSVQVIAANATLYLATARGLYALNASDGSEKWVYPTELPLGNSPTVNGGVVYVGGSDRKLHALNASTGQLLWTFEAGAPFDSNPLVVGDKVFAGNRDGIFYAVYTSGQLKGQLAWSYPTSGAIHLSAAFQNGILYFASDDMYAYALNAQTGNLVWKSGKLPGSGFQSWWPVIYQDYVVFSGSSAYRILLHPGDLIGGQYEVETNCLYPGGIPNGQLLGVREADGWINLSNASRCMEDYSWRRTTIVLNKNNGAEVAFDFDADGKGDYAPLFWFGTRSGNRYPPAVGKDSILYQSAPYTTNGPWYLRGQVVGWRIGTPRISTPVAETKSSDEPIAYAIGGNVVYWSNCCDRSGGAIDLSIPNPGYVDSTREWRYYDEGGLKLASMIPGYKEMYYSEDINTVYGGSNGVYGLHGNQSPPIPYRGKVYMIRSNAIVAFDSSSAPAIHLPSALTRSAGSTVIEDVNHLQIKLAGEVQKILDAGHLRPGYGISGNFDVQGRFDCGEYMMDYFHDPSDSIYTLLRAMPYLPGDMQARAADYVQSEMASYAPYKIVHIGWATGASRDAFDLPPEVDTGRGSFQASQWHNHGISYWQFQPHLYYTLWKYAQAFPGTARQLFDDAVKNAPLPSTPGNALLAQKPFVHNSFIAGYIGFLNLQEMAGYSRDAVKQAELDRLLNLRATTFSKNNPYAMPTGLNYCMATSISRNFSYLTPELGQYLHDHTYNAVLDAVTEYNRIAPYWYISNFEATYGEGVYQPLQDVSGMFQAKGLILQQSFDDLVKYLDAPAFEVGDFYYIQNLVTAIEAGIY